MRELTDIAGEKRGETEKAIRIYDGKSTEWCPKQFVEDNGDGIYNLQDQAAMIVPVVVHERTEDLYKKAFQDECQYQYPALDALEAELGFAINPLRLRNAARVLACPIKANRPSWQRGRMVYAVARSYVRRWLANRAAEDRLQFLDIGTAKGFSALMMAHAVRDSGIGDRYWQIASVDVIDPDARVARNTVAELGKMRLPTLVEIHEAAGVVHEVDGVNFAKSTGEAWLKRTTDRINLAFIDGKHQRAAVSNELELLAARQQSGDVALLDDLQVEGVMRALNDHRRAYTWRLIAANTDSDDPARPHGQRVYAIARRR